MNGSDPDSLGSVDPDPRRPKWPPKLGQIQQTSFERAEHLQERILRECLSKFHFLSEKKLFQQKFFVANFGPKNTWI
jgi:hypothetical protein